jgi:hypothetical protein
MSRKHISPTIQADVIHSTRRKCPICFSYEFDTNIQKGQIAHIDKDSSNNNPENLIFLCLRHHDEYDSKTSQSKGITKEELRKCDNELKEYLSKSFPGSLTFQNESQNTDIEARINRSISNTNNQSPISAVVYKLRLPVYYSYRDFLWKIIRDANYEMKDLFEYLDGTHEAPFLYDQEVTDYLQVVKEKAIEFRQKRRQLELKYNLKDEERSRLIDEETELLIWLTKTYDIGLKLFAKYLNIGKRGRATISTCKYE